MDFNDLALRLERLYASIGQATDCDILKYVHVQRDSKWSNSYVITFDNGKNEAEKANLLFPIIEHLAKLKDHLKNMLGTNSKKVEDEINNNENLQLIMGLSNAEKHGYPLTHSNRSNKKPKLINVKNALVIPPQEQIGINLKTGELVEWNNCYITIDGDVVDEHDVFICHIPQLLSSSTRAWENFIEVEKLA